MPAVGNGRLVEPPPDGPAARRARGRDAFLVDLDAHLVTDEYGIVLDANVPAVHLLQAAREFVIGKPLGLFVTSPDRAAFYEALARLPGIGLAETLELRVGRTGAEPRDVVAVAAALGDGGGRPTAYRWVLRDVTGPRRTERELARERRLLEQLVDTADAVILVVDPGGRILRS